MEEASKRGEPLSSDSTLPSRTLCLDVEYLFRALASPTAESKGEAFGIKLEVVYGL